MGIVIRQSLRNTILSYLGIIIGYFNVLWLFPAVLNVEEIGLLRTILDISILLAPFAQIGLSQSLMKFMPSFEHKEGNFLVFMLGTSIASCTVVLLIIFLFRDHFYSLFDQNSPQVTQYLLLILSLILIMVVHGILEAFCRSKLDTVIITFVRDVFFRILTGGVIFLYFMDVTNLETALRNLQIVYASGVLVLSFRILLKHSIKINWNSVLPDKKLRSQIFEYSFFILLGSGGAIIVGKIDHIMLASMVGLDATGIYSIAFFIAVVIEIPKRSIIQIVIPLISKAFNHNDTATISDIYTKTSINQLIMGLFIFIGIWANIDNIYLLIPNRQVFEAGKLVVLIIGISRLIDMGAGVNGEIIVYSKYYRFNIIAVASLAMLTIATNYLLIPLYGLNGAAMASAISIFLFNLVKYVYIYSKLHIQPFTFKTILVIVIGFLVWYLSKWMPVQANFLLDILLRSAFITLVYFGLVWRLKVSPDLNLTLESFVDKFRKKE